MTTALSKDRLDRLHDVLAAHVEGGGPPGLVSLVARHGEVHVDPVGTTAVGGGRPVREDSLFRISSMTKPVTAVAALVLLEECVLRLDEPVHRLLPELADRRVVRRIDGPADDTVPAGRPITVRDLLTFRLGFGGHLGPSPVGDLAARLGVGMDRPRPALPPAPDEWMRRFGTLPLLAQPGQRWLYHTGADLLGVLIARAAGRPLGEFLRERVFAPLGMVDTGFAVPAADAHRLVDAYVSDPATGAVVPDPAGDQWLTPPAFPSGAGGLVSTAADFLAFAAMLRRGGAPLLGRPSVRTMTTDQLTPAQKALGGLFPDDFAARGWGFGVAVVTRDEDPAAPVGQYGWDGGLGSVWRNDPDEDLTAVLLTNLAWSSPRPPDVALDFLTGAYAALTG